MDRWNLMFIRTYAPSVALAMGALLLMWLLPDDTNNPFLKVFSDIFLWVPLIVLTVSAVSAVWATFRLRQWEQGDALACDCGGLLGRERPGIRGRSDYRKCLACGRNCASRNYL